MKTLAGYLGLILIGTLLYWLDIFAWISGKGFLIFIFGVIAIMFAIAVKLWGNPLAPAKGEDNDENK